MIVYLFGRQLLTRHRSFLLKKLGSKYKQLTIELTTIYILLVALLLLIGSKFSTIGWIIAGLVIIIFGFVSYIFEKDKQ